MRKLFLILSLVLSCVLAQSAAVNWTNRVANIQAETNGYFGRSVNIGAGFADARIYPDSGPAVTPFRLQSTALRLSGNIFEVSNGPGFLILSSDYAGLLSAPDLLLTGDASVQGAVLTDHVVATNGIVTGGLTNTSISQLQAAVTANQVTSTNVITAQSGINTAGMTNTGVTVHTPTAIQTLAAGTVIAWDSSTERVVSTGGAVTLTGTTTIQTNGVPDGALITIRGTSDANTVTLQDYRLLAGTCIAMEMSTVTLANGGTVRFQWSAANQKWQQVDFSANGTQNHKFANLTVQTNATVGGTGGGNLTITNGVLTTVPIDIQGASGQTAAIARFGAGGTNFTYITNTGGIVCPRATLTSGILQLNGSNQQIRDYSSGIILDVIGSVGSYLTSTAYNIRGDTMGFGGYSNPDVIIGRDGAANILALRNGTSAQCFRVYNTWANAGVDYERGTLNWTDNVNSFTIGTKMGGTGTSRSLQFVEGGTNIFYLDGATGNLLWNVDGRGSIGGAGANRPAGINVFGAVTAGGYFYGTGVGLQYGCKLLPGATAGTTYFGDYSNANDWNRLGFGGLTATYPALGRNLAGFTDVVGDNTAPTWHLNSRQITVKTTNYTLVGSAATCSTNTDVSKIFVNYGVTAMSTNTLPTCVAGHTFTFMVEDGDGMMIVAAGGATIRIAATASAANGWISATAIGNTITLVGNSQATEWVALSHEGTWTFGP